MGWEPQRFPVLLLQRLIDTPQGTRTIAAEYFDDFLEQSAIAARVLERRALVEHEVGDLRRAARQARWL